MMKRCFIVGSEWLYYKIYCGYHTTDVILRECVGKVSSDLFGRHLIDKWFYIRYADPHPHIRWRLHFPDTVNVGDAINTIGSVLSYYFDSKIINKVQIDTYERELERYGFETIEFCEAYFYIDSVTIISMLDEISTLNNAELYRWLFAVKSIDSLLNDYQYGLDARIQLINKLSSSFKSEFNVNKTTIKQLAIKYRENHDALFKFMFCLDNNSGNLYDIINTGALTF